MSANTDKKLNEEMSQLKPFYESMLQDLGNTQHFKYRMKFFEIFYFWNSLCETLSNLDPDLSNSPEHEKGGLWMAGSSLPQRQRINLSCYKPVMGVS